MASLGLFRKRLRNSYPHTHSLAAFFAPEIFLVVWRFENLGNPRARKNEVIPAACQLHSLGGGVSILLGKTIFSWPNIWSHTDPVRFLPKSFFHNLVKRERERERGAHTHS